MTALPNVLLKQDMAATSKGAPAAAGKDANATGFMTLLNQALPEGVTLNEDQLRQLLPPQTAGGALPQGAQLNALLSKEQELLANGDINSLAQLLSRLNQTLALSHTGQPVIQDLTKINGQPLPGKADPDSLDAQEMAALSALLAMLPQPAQLQTTATDARSTLHTGRQLAAVTSTPADPLATSALKADQLAASATLQAAQLAATPDLSDKDIAAANLASSGLAVAAKGSADAKTAPDAKRPAYLDAAANSKTAGDKLAETVINLNNAVLATAANRQANDFASARRDPALLNAHNLSATGLTAATAGSEHANTPAATHSTLIQAPLGSQQWQQAISQNIALFTRNGQHSAELRLHPAELGSVKISLKLDDNLAQLQMISPHSHVRAALEAALPVLRAQLAESGIQLGQSHISNGNFSGQPDAGQQGQPQSSSAQSAFNLADGGDNDDALAVPASLVSVAAGNHGVDTFV